MKRKIRSLILGLTVGVALLAAGGLLVHRRQVADTKPNSPPAEEEPHTDPQGGTAGVVAVQLTPDEQQKIGLQTEAVIQEPVADTLATTVPRNAVLDTGGQKIVYIARGDGIFESRPIDVGTTLRDRYTVTRGLSGNEHVVTSGVFMVYSQTRLTGGMTGLFGGSKSFEESAAPGANPASSSPHKVTFRMDPDPPVGGRENNVRVMVSDPSGKTVSDAQVHMTLIMPAMPSMKMPEMRSGADLQWNGNEYTGPISVSMAGPWNIVVEAKRGGALLGTYRSHVEAK